MGIGCCCHLHGVNKSTAYIYSCMTFHSKVPLIARLYLVHLWVTLFFGILCRTGRTDERGIHNSSPTHHPPSSLQTAIDCFKEQLSQSMLLQQMTEFQQCCDIRHIHFQKVNPHKFAHGIAVVDGILHPFI